MDTERIAELRRLAAEARYRAEKATPGPWEPENICKGDGSRWTELSRVDDTHFLNVAYCHRFSDDIEPDPIFIAAARTDVPALAAGLEELAAEVARLRGIILRTGKQLRALGFPNGCVWEAERILAEAEAANG